MSVTADTYMQYHATKQQNARTDPLAEILNNITKHPAAYVTRQTPDACEQYNTKQKEEATDIIHYSAKARNSIRQTNMQAVKDNKTIIKDGDTIRTRSGHISKNSERLPYRWSSTQAQPTCQPHQQMSYGQQHYLTILSIFLYDIFAGWPTGRHSTYSKKPH